VTAYTDGKRAEYRVRDDLIAEGYCHLMTAAGSKGSADLLMAKPGQRLWVQVKRGSKATLGPAARERLIRDAQLAAAVPLLAVVEPRKPIRYVRVWETRLTDWTPDEVGAAT
jgi:hypothetical protein